MAIDCPCYQCELRYPACHSACEEYIAWVDKRTKQKQEQRNSADSIIKDYWRDKYNQRQKYGK